MYKMSKFKNVFDMSISIQNTIYTINIIVHLFISSLHFIEYIYIYIYIIYKLIYLYHICKLIKYEIIFSNNFYRIVKTLLEILTFCGRVGRLIGLLVRRLEV